MSDFAYPYCVKCGNNFPMRQDIHENLEECGNTFYCPQGHPIMTPRSSLISQRDIAERQSTRGFETITRLLKRVESFKGVQTRQRNRLLCGACPYCKITPRDMTKHMKERHGSKVA